MGGKERWLSIFFLLITTTFKVRTLNEDYEVVYEVHVLCKTLSLALLWGERKCAFSLFLQQVS